MVTLGAGRLLRDYIYNAQTEELDEKATVSKFFDRPDDSVTLPYAFDFDGGRRYNYLEIPIEELTTISSQAAELREGYDTCRPFDTNYLNRYKMITRCHAPPSLVAERATERTSLHHVLAIINPEAEDERTDDGLHTAPIFSAVFNDGEEPLDNQHRLTILRDLTAYKLCLVRDFNDDDKFESPELLNQGPNLMVHHRLFRKTLQPKVSLTITIESQMVIRGVMNANGQDRLLKALTMELLCLYMVRHIEFEHRSEYVKGNDFTCHVENFRTVLGFEGLTDELESFVPKVLTSLRSLTFSQTYKGYVIENFKKRIVDIYSQFHTMSSLKLSMFYLNLFLDKVFVDNSTPEKTAIIRDIVHGINSDDLATVMEHFLTDNKIFTLGVGNAREDLVLRVSERAKDLLTSGSSPALASYDFGDFRKYIHSNFITRIEKEEHLMVRMENVDKSESNSVYLTYFRVTKATRLAKLQALVMNHFLSKVVYDHLRNKLNLGYVAQAGLRVYYHNLGIIILVQGENFRPQKVEALVDDMMTVFLEDLVHIEEREFTAVKQNTLVQLTSFSNSLRDVSDKYYDAVEEELLEPNERSYTELMKEVTPKTLQKFAKKYLVKQSRRVTVELFSKRMTDDERNFRLMPSFTLSQQAYKLTTVEEMLARKA